MKTKLEYLLTSRKFWACIIGLVFVLIEAWKPDFPVSEDQVLSLVLVLVSYIIGVAIEDAGRSIAR